MDVAGLIIGGVFTIVFIVLGVMIVRPMDENK